MTVIGLAVPEGDVAASVAISSNGRVRALNRQSVNAGEWMPADCCTLQTRFPAKSGPGAFTRIYTAFPDFTGIDANWGQLVRCELRWSVSDRGAMQKRSKRIEMRLNALCLIASLAASAIPLSAGAVPAEPAGAVPAQSDRQAAVNTPRDMSATPACPPSYYWEPSSYAKHGKFRLAHCARRW